MHRIVAFLWLAASVALAQPKTELPAEAKAEVPALNDFHEVIAQIWHTAWPAKDAKMLASFLPDVEKGAAAVAKAKLPAILHEKEAKWGEGIKKLKIVVEEYKAASKPLDEKRILDAAEKLHMHYEALVRIIRPAVKELDDFHGSLYLLYHYALPEKDLQRVHVLVGELKTKMQKLQEAKLPDRLKEKSKAFEQARKDLGVSVDALHAAVPGGTVDTLRPLIETMHSRYEDLDKVFQ